MAKMRDAVYQGMEVVLYDNVGDDTRVIRSTQVCLQGCSSPSRSYLLLRVKRQFVGAMPSRTHIANWIIICNIY